MSWNDIETRNSRKIRAGQNGSYDLEFRTRWDGTGIPADQDLIDHVESYLPTGLIYPLSSYEIDPAGYNRWKIKAVYSQRSSEQKPPADESAASFDTSGGTQHIKVSRQTLNSYSASGAGTAPTTKNAINVDGQQVGGTDIVVPVYSFEETKIFPFASVNLAYKMNLFAATGTTNNAGFKGFAAGEVLCMGFSGRSRGTSEYSISGRFAASPNLTGLTIGDITGINKGGWNFLWVMFEDSSDQDLLLKKPIHAYVERVYNPSNFGLMGF